MRPTAQPFGLPSKILIAEDRPTQSPRLRYMLAQQGYEVAVIDIGRVALELCFNNKRHCITAGRLQILNLLCPPATPPSSATRNYRTARKRSSRLMPGWKSPTASWSRFPARCRTTCAPLRSISGYSQMLAQDSASTLSSEARRHLKVITESSRQ